jgi:CRP/FNR family transcriptional regulator, cyclic AMP receptor protein
MGAPVALLKQVSLFASLDDQELARLASRFRERRCDRGSPATSRGSAGVGFFVIAHGRAVVKVHGETVRQLGPGDYYGEISMIDGGRRSAQIIADTNLISYGVSRSEFRALVNQHPEIAWALLEAIVVKLREFQDRAAVAAPRAEGARRWRLLKRR